MLEGLRVIERAGSAAGAYTGRLFASCGARVVLVEPPSGAALRFQAPEAFAYLSRGKTSWCVDRATAEQDRAFRETLLGSDVLIESAAPGRLVPLALENPPEHLVRVLISPFGHDGPRSDFLSNEVTDDAWAGHLYLNGEPDREPIVRPGLHAHYQAGVHGFLGALAALRVREKTGRGQTVETTHLEGLASLHQYTTVMWSQAGHKLRRVGNRQGGHFHPIGVYPCRDGYVSLAMPVWVMAEPWLRAAGLDHVLEDPRFCDDFARGRHKDEFDQAIMPWLLAHDAKEIVELAQSVRSPIGPVHTYLDLLDDPHLAAREHFSSLDLEDSEGRVARYRVPGPGFRFEGEKPTLGEVPRLGSGGQPAWGRRTVSGGAVSSDNGDGPLAGVRILDLTRVWAGPLATRILGDLGADVIKIEASWGRGAAEVDAEAARGTHLYADNEVGSEPYNRGASFNKLNRSKRSVTLDLDKPEAKAIFLRLVAETDVVIDNYSPGVLDRLGLGEKQLRRVNEALILVAMPGFGSTGPYRDWLAYGPLIESASGLNAEMGYTDSGPYRSGVAWPDPVTALHAAAATLAALHRRGLSARASAAELPNRGPGATIEVSMLDALVATCGEEILAAQIAGTAAKRSGNRHRSRAPQGCYPCRPRSFGEDCFVALSVESDEQWTALDAELALGIGALGVEERRLRHDEIDRRITERTRAQEPFELVEKLQRRGVVSAVVADAEVLTTDPQLRHLSFWVELEHRAVGRRIYPGLPIRFSETPAKIHRAAPCLGQHNREVLAEVLGMHDGEIQALEDAGLLVERPPPGATARGIRKTR